MTPVKYQMSKYHIKFQITFVTFVNLTVFNPEAKKFEDFFFSNSTFLDVF